MQNQVRRIFFFSLPIASRSGLSGSLSSSEANLVPNSGPFVEIGELYLVTETEDNVVRFSMEVLAKFEFGCFLRCLFLSLFAEKYE